MSQAPVIHWHLTVNDCPHTGDHVCRMCDFDRYYAKTYADCPWADPEVIAAARGGLDI